MLGTLNIKLHRIEQPFLLTGVKIPQPETCIGMESARVYEPTAIRREHRTHTPSLCIAVWMDLSRLSVIHGKLIFPNLRMVCLKRCRLLREVKEAGVGSESWPQGGQAIHFSVHKTHAFSTCDGIEPEFHQAIANDTGLGDDDSIPIGSPLRRDEHRVFSVGQWRGTAAVSLH